MALVVQAALGAVAGEVAAASKLKRFTLAADGLEMSNPSAFCIMWFGT